MFVASDTIPAPGEQQKSAQGGEECASEHAALLSNQMEGAKTAPVDAAGSCHLAGTVYVGRICPLLAKHHPRQQRDHLQRPAQIAEIMHFPPRPDLSERAADPGVMHAVHEPYSVLVTNYRCRGEGLRERLLPRAV